MSSPIKTWRYQWPNEKWEGWGIVFLDEFGSFAALTDFGNYCYRWNRWGDDVDFRKFILECDSSYLARKLAPDSVYDGKKTYQLVKEYLEESYEDGCVTEEQFLNEVELLEIYSNLCSEEDFNGWADSTTIEDVWEMYCKSPTPHAIAFIERCIPKLKALIETELKEEGDEKESS